MNEMSILEIIELRQLAALRRRDIDVEQFKSMIKSSKKIMSRQLAELARSDGVSELDHRTMAALDQFFQIEGSVTDLQEIAQFQHLNGLLKLCISTAKRIDRWSPQQITIATEWAGNLNGYVFSHNDQGFGIIIDNSIMIFLHLFSKIAASLISEEGGYSILLDKELVREKAKDPVVQRRYNEMVDAYVRDGTPSAAPQYLPKAELTPIINGIRDAAELFLVAHECGHIYHDHFETVEMGSDDIESLCKMIDGKPAYLLRHTKELQADNFGFDICLNAVDPQNAMSYLNVAGPLAFFIGLEIIEKALYFHVMGEDVWEKPENAIGQMLAGFVNPATHPKTQFRIHQANQTVDVDRMPDPLVQIWKLFHETLYVTFHELEEERQKSHSLSTEKLSVSTRWADSITEFTSFGHHGSDIISRIKDQSAS